MNKLGEVRENKVGRYLNGSFLTKREMHHLLLNVRTRNTNHLSSVSLSFQVMSYPSQTTDMNVLAARNPDNVLDWLPQRDPQVQILNFLDSNGLLPMRFLISDTIDMSHFF